VQPQNFSVAALGVSLELVSQGWFSIEKEVKPLNLPSPRNRQCPGEEFLAV